MSGIDHGRTSPGRQRRTAVALLAVVSVIGPGAALPSEAPSPAAAPDGSAGARILSPDGTRWVSHEPFDPYPPAGVETAVTFHVGTVEPAAPPVAITVPGVGRTIDAVRWIDSRFVLVGADILSSILDAETGTLSGQVYGMDFAVAPGEARIAFRFGLTPRYFWQDGPPASRVGLWYRTESDASAAGWSWMDVYPEVRLTPAVNYGEPPLAERHLLVSGFAWSPSGRRLAFVEDHEGARWLVVLDLESAPSGSAPAQRFAVPLTIEDVESLRWNADETMLEIDGPEGHLRWALEAGVGRLPAAGGTNPLALRSGPPLQRGCHGRPASAPRRSASTRAAMCRVIDWKPATSSANAGRRSAGNWE